MTEKFSRRVSRAANSNAFALRGLINYPVLILADEPTGNLDEVNQNLVMKVFHELHAEGHTIITVTHSPDVGREAQRCIRLKAMRNEE